MLYCDLDNFKAYNDQKGFVRGDRLIQAAARIIQDAVVEDAGAEGFVGHVGGDDFVAVVPPDVRRGRRQEASASGSTRRAPSSTSPRTSTAGSSGSRTARACCRTSRSSPSRSASRPRRARQFAHYGEAVAVATEMKQFAKRDGGSSYAVDRRTDVDRRAGSSGGPRIRLAPILARTKLVSGAGCEVPTGGDSPRPPGSQSGVDPVRFRDRP